MQKDDKIRQSNQSAEKVLTLIELMAHKGEPMRLLDISSALGFNASTVLRYLVTLMHARYVEQDPQTQQYYLTFKLCTIANAVSSNVSVRDIARPYMKQLSHVFGESVCLAVDQQMMVVYVDVVDVPDQMLRTMQRIGNIAPLHCAGVGKLFLLQYGEDDLDRFITTKGLPSFTNHTLTSKMQLQDELKRVRQSGYAVDDEECEIGARCFAVPLRDYTGKIVAGISVTGPSSRMTDEYVQQRLEYLHRAAAEISGRLGYQAPALQHEVARAGHHTGGFAPTAKLREESQKHEREKHGTHPLCGRTVRARSPHGRSAHPCAPGKAGHTR